MQLEMPPQLLSQLQPWLPRTLRSQFTYQEADMDSGESALCQSVQFLSMIIWNSPSCICKCSTEISWIRYSFVYGSNALSTSVAQETVNLSSMYKQGWWRPCDDTILTFALFRQAFICFRKPHTVRIRNRTMTYLAKWLYHCPPLNYAPPLDSTWDNVLRLS